MKRLVMIAVVAGLIAGCGGTTVLVTVKDEWLVACSSQYDNHRVAVQQCSCEYRYAIRHGEFDQLRRVVLGKKGRYGWYVKAVVACLSST